MGLGLGWVARLLLLDAVISPSATAMAYMGASARVSWMMGRCGLLPSSFGRLNRQAVPSVALLVSLAMGVLMLLSGPSWQTVVSFLTATLVIALAMGPVSLISLRRQLPDAQRAYRLPWAGVWCSSAFVLATWAISWCGTSSLRGASLIVLVPAGVFALADRQHLRHGLWWFFVPRRHRGHHLNATGPASPARRAGDLGPGGVSSSHQLPTTSIATHGGNAISETSGRLICAGTDFEVELARGFARNGGEGSPHAAGANLGSKRLIDHLQAGAVGELEITLNGIGGTH
jgi:Amino acid transporters